MSRSAAQPAAGIHAAAPADPSSFERFSLSLRARWGRLAHWEFWPAWAVYAPLMPYLAWLSLRHGGIGAFTAANPAIPLGGLVGESKWDILRKLPEGSIVPTIPVPEHPYASARCAALLAQLRGPGWSFPLILKPDVGERGAGVRLVRAEDQAAEYLRDHPGPAIAQQFHPGPREAGVFYVREPGRESGRILSITDKRFPVITGDGRSTLAALIHRHRRFGLQSRVFLARLGDGAARVPAAGEAVPLGVAGNHCQGTMFLDGRDLITPELSAAFDRIARAFPGFHFGRFDVRYADQAEFRAGRGFKIVELNGVLSESTNIYDPSTGFWKGQRTLREQWRLAYSIGAANRRAGARAASLPQLVRAFRSHLSRPNIDPRAD